MRNTLNSANFRLNVNSFWLLVGYLQQLSIFPTFVFNLLTCCKNFKIASIRVATKRTVHMSSCSLTKFCNYFFFIAPIKLFAFSFLLGFACACTISGCSISTSGFDSSDNNISSATKSPSVTHSPSGNT